MTNVEVIDENDISRKFKVKIKGEPNKDIKIFKPCLIKRIILCILVCILMGFLFFGIVTFCNCLNNSESFDKNNLEEAKQKGLLICEVVLYSSYLISLIFVISILIYQLVKNTEEIRFAKLNELHNLRTQVIEDLNKSFQDYEQTEENTSVGENKTNVKIDAADKGNNSELEITLNGPIMKSIKKKNLKEELLKQYMNAIVEI